MLLSRPKKARQPTPECPKLSSHCLRFRPECLHIIHFQCFWGLEKAFGKGTQRRVSRLASNHDPFLSRNRVLFVQLLWGTAPCPRAPPPPSFPSQRAGRPSQKFRLFSPCEESHGSFPNPLTSFTFSGPLPTLMILFRLFGSFRDCSGSFPALVTDR